MSKRFFPLLEKKVIMRKDFADLVKNANILSEDFYKNQEYYDNHIVFQEQVYYKENN